MKFANPSLPQQIQKEFFLLLNYIVFMDSNFYLKFIKLITKYINSDKIFLGKYNNTINKFETIYKKGFSYVNKTKIGKYAKHVVKNRNSIISEDNRNIIFPIYDYSYSNTEIEGNFNKKLWGCIGLSRENEAFSWDEINLIRKVTNKLKQLGSTINDRSIRRIKHNLAKRVMKEENPINLCYQIIHSIEKVITYNDRMSLLLFHQNINSFEIIAETQSKKLIKNKNIGKHLIIPNFHRYFKQNEVIEIDGTSKNWEIFKYNIMNNRLEIRKKKYFSRADRIFVSFFKLSSFNKVSALILPVFHNEKILGIITIYCDRSKAYNYIDILRMAEFSDYLEAVLVKVYELHVELNNIKNITKKLKKSAYKKHYEIEPTYFSLTKSLSTRLNGILKADSLTLFLYSRKIYNFDIENPITVGNFKILQEFMKDTEEFNKYKNIVLSDEDYESKLNNYSIYSILLKDSNGSYDSPILGAILAIFYKEVENKISRKEKETIEAFRNYYSEIIKNLKNHRRTIKELKVTKEMNDKLGRQGKIETILKTFFKQAFDLVNADAGCFAIPDYRHNNLKIIAKEGLDRSRAGRFINYNEGVTGVVAVQKRMIEIKEENNPQEGIKPLPWVKDAHCEFAVPLVIGNINNQEDKLVGVLSLERSKNPEKFADSDFQMIRRLCSHACIAIENARDKALLLKLHEICNKISSYRSDEDILREVLKSGKNITGASFASARLLNPRTNKLQLICRVGEKGALGNKDISLGSGVNGWVALNQKTCYLGNVENIKPFQEKYPNLCYIRSRKSTKSELTIPLLSGNICIGVVNFEHTSLFGFSQDIKFIEILVNHASMELYSLEKKKLEIELKEAEMKNFLSNISHWFAHDIRKRVIEIDNNIDRIREDKDNKQGFQIVHNEINAIYNMIDNIKNQLPKQGQRKSDFECTSFTNYVIKKLKERYKTNAIRIGLPKQIKKKKYIHINQYEIENCITTIVDNSIRAIKNNKDGKIEIKFSVGIKYYKIFIKDNGIGIHKSKLKDIFSLVKSWDTDNFGMGLYLCQETIKDHNGIIHIDSEKMQGTTVTIILNIIKS